MFLFFPEFSAPLIGSLHQPPAASALFTLLTYVACNAPYKHVDCHIVTGCTCLKREDDHDSKRIKRHFGIAAEFIEQGPDLVELRRTDTPPGRWTGSAISTTTLRNCSARTGRTSCWRRPATRRSPWCSTRFFSAWAQPSSAGSRASGCPCRSPSWTRAPWPPRHPGLPPRHELATQRARAAGPRPPPG